MKYILMIWALLVARTQKPRLMQIFKLERAYYGVRLSDNSV